MTYNSNHIPLVELELRRKRCLGLLGRLLPEANGILLFSAVNIYYLTGFMGKGALWLPSSGSPLLFLSKGVERARLDSPHTEVIPCSGYGDIASYAGEKGVPLGKTFAVEKQGIAWSDSLELRAAFADAAFLPGDEVLSLSRAVKTDWELHILRKAGKRHAQALEELLPAAVKPGMTEKDISTRLFDICLSLGNCGISRMHNFGQEMLMGEVSVGDSGNYPTSYDGPLGFRGMHGSAPYMGSAQNIWQPGSLLTVDTVFCLEGYNTDKTVCYFSGKRASLPDKAKKAHAFCCAVEERVAGLMRPGVQASSLYDLALEMAEEQGFSEGFMGLGKNKVKFLGHSIGFCVDEPPVMAKGFDIVLEPGMVFAVEPKVGIDGFGMVGTENTWLVTQDGTECLTGGIRGILCLG